MGIQDGQISSGVDLQSLIRSSQMQQGPAAQGGTGVCLPIFFLGGGHGRLDNQVGKQLSIEGSAGINCQATAKFQSQRQLNWFEKLCQSTGFNRKDILDGISKCHSPVSQSSIDSIVGPKHDYTPSSRVESGNESYFSP